MLIPLKLVRDQPLQQQLYEQLRELIVSGRLSGGARMPSTRMLAEQFTVSRITVLLTYERLIAESYLTTVPAKGTFVTQTPVRPPLSRAKRSATDSGGGAAPAGRPDARLFPAGRWRALIRDALDGLGASLSAEHPDGDPALLAAIAHWLSTSRGLAVCAGQIVLANGRQHALHIATHLLLRPGVRVVIEAPCDPRTEALIASTGATIGRISVDRHGMRTELLPEGPAALALVTPEHQRPLGVVMSEARRHALLAWAERSGAIVVADDVDGEMRYEAMESAPLLSLDGGCRVIHLGGFAMSLGPGVQLAYLVVPRAMIESVRAASRLVDDNTGRLESAALANLLESGGYARHLHQLRKIYLGRRDAMVRALRRHFGTDIELAGQTAGLHLTWHLPPRLGSAGMVAEFARQQGLDSVALGEETVLIGFGAPDEVHLDKSVARLAKSLQDVAPLGAALIAE